MKDATFQVMSGEILAIVAESGSGATTLARMLLGLLDASSGRIPLDGRDATRLHTPPRPPPRALLVQPDLLVADEPTSILDTSMRANILNLIRTRNA